MMKIFKMFGKWSEWVKELAKGLYDHCRWRLPVVLGGMLFAKGRRTVTSWLRAAGITKGFSDYYHFMASIGRRTEAIAARLLGLLQPRLPSASDHVLVAIDDTPTKRYGPKVEGAGIHHNPTPGPAGGKFLYGHVWVTLAWIAPHAQWGTRAFPLLSKLYVRLKDIAKLPAKYGCSFQTKLQQAATLVEWIKPLVAAGKRLWVVVDGFYTKRPFLKPVLATHSVVIGRLRKDAAVYDLPRKLKKGQRRGPGRPPTYGRKRISLAKRAGQPRGWQSVECVQYGERVTKTIKSFPATYHPAGGEIQVVIVREDRGPQFFFGTGSEITAVDILEGMADRGAVESMFRDLKETAGAGQQQVRRFWRNLGAWHLHLWLDSLVELWAWRKGKASLCDRRDSPWDDAERRPSHADRRKALRRQMLREEFSAVTAGSSITSKIRRTFEKMLTLAG
jgi:hypothetical protein